jgi:hypothetical protein
MNLDQVRNLASAPLHPLVFKKVTFLAGMVFLLLQLSLEPGLWWPRTLRPDHHVPRADLPLGIPPLLGGIALLAISSLTARQPVRLPEEASGR